MCIYMCRLEAAVVQNRERSAMALMDFIYATMLFKYSKTRRRNNESTFEIIKQYMGAGAVGGDDDDVDEAEESEESEADDSEDGVEEDEGGEMNV